MVVVTEVFVNLARTAARAHGLPDLRLVALPHPLESRTEADVRAIARARMRDLLGPLARDVG
ncbi:MAG TPA: hypothetical protein VNO26_16375 [Candidatus Limnocylindria bacterium]|nr:hypothetical protein [Candidatus Limnocylindria bacterium]